MSEERYYAVRLLWVRDQEIWQKYQEMVRPVLARHDVRMEHWLMTDRMIGEGIDKPDLIVVTSYPSVEAFQAFQNDSDFQKASALRDRGAKLVTITGNAAMLAKPS